MSKQQASTRKMKEIKIEITGIAGSGKTTLALFIANALIGSGVAATVIDEGHWAAFGDFLLAH